MQRARSVRAVHRGCPSEPGEPTACRRPRSRSSAAAYAAAAALAGRNGWCPYPCRMAKVKVCGMTNLADAEHAVTHGAWAIGMIHHPDSPRYVEPEIAEEIGAAL